MSNRRDPNPDVDLQHRMNYPTRPRPPATKPFARDVPLPDEPAPLYRVDAWTARMATCRAEHADSWRVAPQLYPGYIVIVGASGHEHAYIVETIERDGWPDGSIELTAIEAGQVDAQGRQCVRGSDMRSMRATTCAP